MLDGLGMCSRYIVHLSGDTLTETCCRAYEAVGFEIALHVDTGCTEYTASSLDANYGSQLASMAATYPGSVSRR